MEERGSVSSGGHLRVSGKHGGRGHSDMPSKVGGNFALGRADQAAHGVGGWLAGWGRWTGLFWFWRWGPESPAVSKPQTPPLSNAFPSVSSLPGSPPGPHNLPNPTARGLSLPKAWLAEGLGS